MAEPAPESFPHPENNEPQQEPDALAICDELNDLRIETDGGSSTAGVYAHDELFGTSRLHARLVALGQMRASYKQRFAGGDVREIADFAVTSGHEAVAFFAGRLASYTRVRRSTIPRCRDEFAAARATDNPTAVTTTEIALHRAGEDFAKAVNSALQGWHEHYPWIRRSIEDERIRHQGRVTEHVLEQAAKVRSNDDQLRGQLQSIVNQGSSTPAAACKLWRDLRREGRRFFRIVNGVEVVNFPN
jgi:hypothetical protein